MRGVSQEALLRHAVLLCISMMGQLFDVMHQAVQLPLRVDLLLSAQRESREPLVVTQIAEHWLDRREPLPISKSAFRTIDPLLHPIAVVLRPWH